MLLSRRCAITHLGVAPLVLGAVSARAGDAGPFAGLVRQALSRRWEGISEIPTDAVSSGKWVSKLAVEFKLDQAFDFTGYWRESFNLDERRYSALFAMSGSCWHEGEDVGISIPATRLLVADTPPAAITWDSSSVRLSFASDANRPGHFILEGTARGGNGGVWKVTLIDVD